MQALEDGFFLYTRSTVNANGNPTFSQVAFKLDGKDYPLYSSGALAQFLTSGRLSVEIMTFKAVDANTLEILEADDNEQPGVFTRTFTVSPDGRTMTQKVTGTDGQGRAVNRMRVFDKVQ